jgi:prolyl oligopeptidase
MAPTPWTPDKYPLARRSDHVDVYQSKAQGSVQIPDPYQWLETNTTETDDWVTAQEAFTRAYLDQVCFPADES